MVNLSCTNITVAIQWMDILLGVCLEVSAHIYKCEILSSIILTLEPPPLFI